jgi:hypothetical protein
MLPSLFATVFCTVIPSTTPLESPALRADGSLAAQVGLHVTPTHLSARNFSATPQILALSDAQTGQRALVALDPHTRVEFSYPREALEFVRLEVLSLGLRGWNTSGALDLGAALTSGAQTIWIQQAGPHTFAWLQLGAQLSTLDANGSVLPESLRPALQSGQDELAPACAPAHVPVITPSDTPDGDAPPKLGQRPLPPV